MEKFNRTLRGYDPDEVNDFLDKVIGRVEDMVHDMKVKDDTINRQKKEIESYKAVVDENKNLKEKLAQYERIEGTLNRAIMMAQKTSDQMRLAASKEGELLVEEAKKNANRIVNEALLRAEKTEFEANMLRRNIGIFKRRIKDIVEAQLEVVEELEKVDLQADDRNGA